ncbi:MAG: tyrosine-type recombinase/integrase [Limnohabitans sp.]
MRTGSLHTQQDADRFCALQGAGRMAISDARTRGLQLERMASGRAKWRLRFSAPGGRHRVCMTIGDASILSLADARKMAEKLLREAALGMDPKREKEECRNVPSFARFIEESYMPYVKSYKRSWSTDECLLRNHLLPRFGDRYLDEITRQDMQKMHRERRAAGGAPSSANRLLIMMRYIFNLAIKWDTPGIKINPCKGIPLLEENNNRERYLSVQETQRLYQAVLESDNTMLKFIVPMLILTGARKRELLDARWQDFDLDRRIWRIPVSKSGKARHVPLSDGALAVLLSMPHQRDCPWAFANPDTGKPYVSIYFAWNTARKHAGLADVRMHDLRHSFASLLINSGRTLYEVQHILGHTQIKTTQRYAHLSQETLLAAANAAAEAVGTAIAPIVGPAIGPSGGPTLGRTPTAVAPPAGIEPASSA